MGNAPGEDHPIKDAEPGSLCLQRRFLGATAEQQDA